VTDKTDFLAFFSEAMGQLFVTLHSLRILSRRNNIHLCFAEQADFVLACAAAAAANIRCGLFNSFAPDESGTRTISSCVMAMELDGNCEDKRLLVFLAYVIRQRRLSQPLEPSVNRNLEYRLLAFDLELGGDLVLRNEKPE
jgi:hypothetical protein